MDDLDRMRELIAMGLDGIVSNDPRMFEVAEREPLPVAEASTEPEGGERRRGLFGLGRKKGAPPEEAEEAG